MADDESSAATAILAEPAPDARRTLVLAACLMATFMAAVESTIVATAMPTIIADLRGFNLYSWVFTIYLLSQAISIPIYGRLADLYGRKRMFFVGAGLFMVSSAMCGLSTSMVQLIIFRALQGFGGGGVQPVAMTILGDVYTPAERAHVQGLVSSVFGVSAVIGPLLGAFLVEHVNWEFVFWVNLPVGAAAITMIAVFLREDIRPRARSIDWLGSLLMMVSISALLLALVQQATLSRLTLTLLVGGGLVTLAALVLHERAIKEPMLPLELWKQRVIAVGSVGGGLAAAVMMGVSAFLPTYVQGAMGESPTIAGAGAGHDVGDLGGGQYLWWAADGAHQLPAGGHAGRRGAARGLPAAGDPDAGTRTAVGLGRVAGGGHRHGVLQHVVHRRDPGRGAMASAWRGNIVLHVHAVHRAIGRGGVIRGGAESDVAPSRTGSRGDGRSSAGPGASQ
jgi:multidrug resistance protein